MRSFFPLRFFVFSIACSTALAPPAPRSLSVSLSSLRRTPRCASQVRPLPSLRYGAYFLMPMNVLSSASVAMSISAGVRPKVWESTLA